MSEVPFRIMPRVNAANEHFWKGGATGKLQFLRCQDQACGTYIHPPAPVCPDCHNRDVAPEAVTGRATVSTYTINHQNWMPGPELPYVVAIVEMDEQIGLRLTTNIIGCSPNDVHIDMPVQVTFEAHDDIYIPLFEPVK